MPDLLEGPPAPVLPEYRGIKAVKEGLNYAYRVHSANELLVIRVRWLGGDHLGWEAFCLLGDLVLSERFTGWATIDEATAAYDRLWNRLLEYVRESRDHQAKVLRGWDSALSQMEALTITTPVFWERLG